LDERRLVQDNYGARISRHEQAVIQAEVRRLARCLKPYRILHRDALERACGAEKWHEGGFERALQEAVKAGAVQSLPGGFYREAAHASSGEPAQGLSDAES
jgi:hypothetical protein